VTWRDQTERASKHKRKRKRRALFHCGTCGRQYSNPLGHRCEQGGDFARRGKAEKRAQETAARREKAAARRAAETGARRERRLREDEGRRARRAKENAAAKTRKRKAAARRRGRPEHDYRNCRDADCQRVACEAYREGFENGWEAKPPEQIPVPVSSS
jgi:hypothetical protein